MKTVIELKQRRFFTVKKFLITEIGVKVEEQKIGQSTEIFFPYDKISNDIEKYSFRSIKLLIAFIVLFTFFVITLIPIFFSNDVGVHSKENVITWGVLSFIFFIVYLFSIKNLIVVNCSEGRLPFFRNIPNSNTVEKFIENIFAKRKEYYINKITKIDGDYNLEELFQRYRWLHDNDIISDQEYQELKNKLIVEKKDYTLKTESIVKNILQ